MRRDSVDRSAGDGRRAQALSHAPPALGGSYSRWGKRALDLALSLPALLLISPFLVVLAAFVRLWLGSPVLFLQERPGLRGRLFTLYKFRTMTDGRDRRGNLLPDAQRLAPLGRFLRSTSLDEFPELWNVFRGDMSLIGPRPLLTQYLDGYTPEQARRHDVRPGITGWAQINGRNAVSWEEKFKLDVWYVDHVSLMLDVKILGMTLAKVVAREGVEFPDSEALPVFWHTLESQEPRSKGEDSLPH